MNGGALTLIALALLAGSSWSLGAIVIGVIARLDASAVRGYERAALRLTAGLGLTSLLLSFLTLAGWFAAATPILAVLALAAVALGVRWGSDPVEVSAIVRAGQYAVSCSGAGALRRAGVPWRDRADHGR